MPTYDKKYFIEKFSSIPDSLVAAVGYHGDDGKACALGHCGCYGQCLKELPEAYALAGLFESPVPSSGAFTKIAAINDGTDLRYQQPTTKARILAALRDLPDPLA